MGLLGNSQPHQVYCIIVAGNGDDCQAHFPFLQWELLQSLETNREEALGTGKLLLAEVS